MASSLASEALFPRGLSTDTKINLIIGIFTIVTGILSTLLAWAMWRLTRDRRHRHAREHFSPTSDSGVIELLPTPAGARPRLAYEVALRFGGTL
ncbi:hypothetical protein L207DRAFT_510866 [Hyaloscypha variabilis F]|uniref:Uncharacterized protein n=1 Tax=Hyaloscypha variabilis (strain UAMH 11265 / GT02V1 / F) TaxID=1149755 RepID=A0A2J6RVU2_HYAVF|nr:hypothetical protein L207DRAFT_510866 [Hyaloscypha variabilis F]